MTRRPSAAGKNRSGGGIELTEQTTSTALEEGRRGGFMFHEAVLPLRQRTIFEKRLKTTSAIWETICGKSKFFFWPGEILRRRKSDVLFLKLYFRPSVLT